MKRLTTRMVIVAALALAVTLVLPAYGEQSVVGSPDDGLTRDSLAESSTPARSPTPAAATAPFHHRRTSRAHFNAKNFVSMHHAHRHRHSTKPKAQLATARPVRRRNPVTRFVYWWNGWVIRTFHTKFGTVMLGTVGAES